jgi:cysteine desulfurase
MRRIYMDANATTPLAPEVFDAMRPWLIESYGNASSIHYYGQKARGAVEEARMHVAKLLNCRPAEIVFTSGGTESDNLAIFGLVSENARPGDHLITSSIEHHAVLHAAECLQKRGVAVTYLPVGSDCVVDPDDLRRALRPNTKLISIMMANNETGAIQPVEEIGKIAAEAEVYFHTDAVQAAGKLPIDVEKIGCDLLAIAGHKMYAPQGVGALYVHRSTQIEPLFFGGTHERQRRAGTENVAGIVGLGKAAQLALKSLGAPQSSGAPFKPVVGLSGTVHSRHPEHQICHPERSAIGAESKDLRFASNSANPGGTDQLRHPERSAIGAESKDLRFASNSTNSGGTDQLRHPERSAIGAESKDLRFLSNSTNEISDISRIAHLRDRLENGLLTRLENVGVNAGNTPRVPNTTNLYFDHLEGEALVIALDMKGLSVSGGSACASGAAEPSHVLSAMGLSPQRGRASLRFSLTKFTTEEEIDFALETIPAAVNRLREISPVYAGTLG